MTHSTDDQTLPSRTSEPEAASQATAPAPPELESGAQFRAGFGKRSRQWEYRRSLTDPDFPKPIFIGPRRFYRVADRFKYIRILEERSAKKAEAKAIAKAAKEARLRALKDAANTD